MLAFHFFAHATGYASAATPVMRLMLITERLMGHGRHSQPGNRQPEGGLSHRATHLG